MLKSSGEIPLKIFLVIKINYYVQVYPVFRVHRNLYISFL